MARVYERLGSWVLPREFEDIGLETTPQNDPYEEETYISLSNRRAKAQARGG